MVQQQAATGILPTMILKSLSHIIEETLLYTSETSFKGIDPHIL